MNFATTSRRFLELLGLTFASSQLSASHGSVLAEAAFDEGGKTGTESVLWFQQPAAQGADALPLGNGRLGAMVFGGSERDDQDVRQERIALNEDTLWSGNHRDWNNPEAKTHLSVVRKLVLEQADYQAADEECRKMQGPYNQAFEPVGDLLIKLDHQETVTDYRRELDLDRGVATVRYSVPSSLPSTNGAERVYTREVFVSAPAQVIVVHLACSQKSGLNCTVGFASQLQSKTEVIDNRTLHVTGKAPSESVPFYLKSDNPVQYSEEEGKGMRFAAVLDAQLLGSHADPRAVDGRIERLADGSLKIEEATGMLLLVGISTGYRGYPVAPDMPLADVLEVAARPVARAMNESYEKLYAAHLKDYQALYRRVAIDLGKEPGGEPLATDKRVAVFETQPDPALIALYFNLGRYLLMASSRPGTQPANLQGIWSNELRPPWSANWTSNINVQMNYWPVETCNLSECHLPLAEMITDLSLNGHTTAQVNYGADG